MHFYAIQANRQWKNGNFQTNVLVSSVSDFNIFTENIENFEFLYLVKRYLYSFIFFKQILSSITRRWNKKRFLLQVHRMKCHLRSAPKKMINTRRKMTRGLAIIADSYRRFVSNSLIFNRVMNLIDFTNGLISKNEMAVFSLEKNSNSVDWLEIVPFPQFLAVTVKNTLLFDMGLCINYPVIIIAAVNEITRNDHNKNERLNMTVGEISWLGIDHNSIYLHNLLWMSQNNVN